VIADGHLAKAFEAARQALGADDAVLAENVLQNVSEWQACCSPALGAEWKAVHSEISAAKKVLRFRKRSRS
jgi:hypothetical protein